MPSPVQTMALVEGLEDAPQTARRHDNGLGAYDVDLAGLYLHDDGAGAATVFYDEVQNEPLLIDADASPHYLFVENVEQRLSGEVGYEEGSRLALTAKGAGAESPLPRRGLNVTP